MENKLSQRDSSIIRVVLYGPESTGKTTLAQQLATHYNTSWAPEYMRLYLDNKITDPEKELVTYEELIPIAKGQMWMENKKLETANTFLFCDTNLMELEVYANYYFGKSPKELSKYALKNTYELYVLTHIDVPWEIDAFRDRPEDRETMFNLFEQRLVDTNKPYIIAKGTEEDRLHFVIRYIDSYLLKE